MRFSHVLGLAGFVLSSFGGTALAQNSGGSFLYVPSTGNVGYAPQGTTGAVPFYNNTAQPLPMDQMIAGKNAPSYSYRNEIKPYNLGNQSSGDGTMSAEDFMRARSSRDQRAQQYENEYLQRLAARDAALNGNSQASAGQGYSASSSIQQAQPKRKKRLVYREDANPLAAPPLLFNPDQ
jgi:hypothetical protein